MLQRVHASQWSLGAALTLTLGLALPTEAAIIGGVVSTYNQGDDGAPPRDPSFISSPGVASTTSVAVPFRFDSADPSTGNVAVTGSFFRTNSLGSNTGWGTLQFNFTEATFGLTKVNVWQYIDSNSNAAARSGLKTFAVYYSTNNGSSWTQLTTQQTMTAGGTTALTSASKVVDISAVNTLGVTNIRFQGLSSVSTNTTEKRIGLAQVIFEGDDREGRVIFNSDFDNRLSPGNTAGGGTPGSIEREGWVAVTGGAWLEQSYGGSQCLTATVSTGASSSVKWGDGLPVNAGWKYRLEFNYLPAGAGAYDLTIGWGNQTLVLHRTDAAGVYTLDYVPTVNGLASLTALINNVTGTSLTTGIDNIKITMLGVPEPASLALLGLGALLMLPRRKSPKG